MNSEVFSANVTLMGFAGERAGPSAGHINTAAETIGSHPHVFIGPPPQSLKRLTILRAKNV